MLLWRDGKSVLLDHVYDAPVRTTASGRVVAVDTNCGGIARPVLCGWIVPIHTEDGPSDGRCAAPVVDADTAECVRGHERPPSWVDDMDRADAWWDAHYEGLDRELGGW